MQLRSYAIARLKAARNEASSLLDGEFPYDDPKFLIHRIYQILDAHIEILEDPSLAPDVAKFLALSHLREIDTHLQLLGFALRSTNLRNAFETYGPLLRLASQLLQRKKKQEDRKTMLVIGSEWAYSPFLIPETATFPGYVLLGLPAPESGNPLLVPIAGHEFGHAVWCSSNPVRTRLCNLATHRLASQVRSHWFQWTQLFPGQYPAKKPTITTLRNMPQFLRHTYALEAHMHRQVEETFCDLLGLRLFGMSYINAFSYLVYPGSSRTPPHYPHVKDRLKALVYAAEKFTIRVRNVDVDAFQSPTSTADNHTALANQLKSSVIFSMLDQLIAEVSVISEKAGIELPNEVSISRASHRLLKCIPVDEPASLSTILNAAWRIYDSRTRMNRFEGPTDVNRKQMILKDLVLKSFELQEMLSIQAER